jgi:putative membrane protein
VFAESLINLVKGIFIGIAMVIPGLTGSMFAVASGLYERMICAVMNIREDLEGSLAFLAPLALGVIVGILLSANTVMRVMVRFPSQSYCVFLGLALGSLPVAAKKARAIKFRPFYLGITALAFLGLMLLAKTFAAANPEFIAIRSVTSPKDALILGYAGLTACSLMVLPGVSGGVILTAINQYGTLYNAVGSCSRIIPALVGGDTAGVDQALQGFAVLIPFGLGAVLGFVIIAKAIMYLLNKHKALTYYGIGGFMLGAAATLALQCIMPYTPGMSAALIAACIACGIAGFGCTSVLCGQE